MILDQIKCHSFVITVKGYYQSHLTDTPPTPNIYYAGQLIEAKVEINPGTMNLKSNVIGVLTDVRTDIEVSLAGYLKDGRTFIGKYNQNVIH